MPKTAALPTRARVSAPRGDARELHDDGRDEAQRQRGFDETVHGDVGLDEGGAGRGVDGEDAVQGREVQEVCAFARGARRVGGAVADAVFDALRVVGLDLSGDVGHFGGVVGGEVCGAGGAGHFDEGNGVEVWGDDGCVARA